MHIFFLDGVRCVGKTSAMKALQIKLGGERHAQMCFSDYTEMSRNFPTLVANKHLSFQKRLAYPMLQQNYQYKFIEECETKYAIIDRTVGSGFIYDYLFDRHGQSYAITSHSCRSDQTFGIMQEVVAEQLRCMDAYLKLLKITWNLFVFTDSSSSLMDRTMRRNNPIDCNFGLTYHASQHVLFNETYRDIMSEFRQVQVIDLKGRFVTEAIEEGMCNI